MELLTLEQIARQLNLSPSTVRYYNNKYREFMPGVKAGRYLKYEPEAVEIIKLIAAATAATKQQQEIKELLSAKFALNIEQTDNEQSTAATATTQQQQHSNNTDISSRENCKALAQANKEIIYLRGIIERLLYQNQDLARRVMLLEPVKQSEQRPGLWQRIFKRE